MDTTHGVTAGWHPDPAGRHQLRYYDGRSWTEHVANNGLQALDPLPDPTQDSRQHATPPSGRKPRTKPRRGKIIFLSGLAAIALVVVIPIATRGGSNTAHSKTIPASTTSPTPDTSVDQHTRAYVDAVVQCQDAIVILLAQGNAGQTDDVTVAKNTIDARNTCDEVRSALPTIDTTHFANQASEAWYGVDRIKSGLNAMLTYLDSGAPTKLVEAQQKIHEGLLATNQGLRAINQRRRLYGLESLRLAS